MPLIIRNIRKDHNIGNTEPLITIEAYIDGQIAHQTTNPLTKLYTEEEVDQITGKAYKEGYNEGYLDGTEDYA